jgi:hypothetical protein
MIPALPVYLGSIEGRRYLGPVHRRESPKLTVFLRLLSRAPTMAKDRLTTLGKPQQRGGAEWE